MEQGDLNTRASRKYLRNSNRHKVYFSRLVDLRRAHNKLYNEEEAFTVRQSVVSDSGDTGVLEAVLRIRATKTNLRARVIRRASQLLEEFGDEEPFILYQTANVVLTKTDDSDQDSYCLFYGQVFSPTGKITQEDTQLEPPILFKSVEELRDLPDSVDLTDVTEKFEKCFEDTSQVNVYEVVSIVYIFRRYLESVDPSGQVSPPPALQ